MGSITSRPKVPAASSPQVVYVPAQVSPSTVPSGGVSSKNSSDDANTGRSNTNSQNNEGANKSSENVSDALREKNLLSRQRGRLSTVLTGFRGVLSNTLPSTSARKNLLGE